ncbi:MAG: hypothetical protein AAF236_13215 [Verrucomicrobiota bacterium]
MTNDTRTPAQPSGAENNRLVKLMSMVNTAAIVFFVLLFVPWKKLHDPAKVRAANQAYNLKHAISAFYTERRRYPVSRSPIESDSDLMSALLGTPESETQPGISPRGIAFYAGKQAEKSGDLWTEGLHPENQTLYDPWGSLFRIALDAEAEGQIENPEIPGSMILESVLIWSAGPDQDFDTWEDNVTTW